MTSNPSTGRRGRRGLLVSVIAAALAVLGSAAFGPTVAAQDVNGDDGGETSAITITTTPAEQQGECDPAPFPRVGKDSYAVFSDESVFRLTVTVSAPLCDPITATAAVYAMPGNGEAWPQTLVETEDVVIAEAGEYVFEFAKECDPVQFDVINGVTPEVIALEGPYHGPLLFPGDIQTAQQFPGDPNCNTTTTTESTTTTTESTTTTETTQPEVLGSTTITTPEPTTPEPTPGESPTEVAAAVQTPSGGSATSPRQLALTGSGSTPMLLAGLVLVAGGVGFVLLGRRERPEAS